jgi:hypothetical protein
MTEIKQIDQEVEKLLNEYMGRDAKLALDTYTLGLRMRSAISKEIEQKSSEGVSSLKAIAESEVFQRALLLVVIPLLSAAIKSPSISKQLRRLCIR